VRHGRRDKEDLAGFMSAVCLGRRAFDRPDACTPLSCNVTFVRRVDVKIQRSLRPLLKNAMDSESLPQHARPCASAFQSSDDVFEIDRYLALFHVRTITLSNRNRQ